MPLRVLSPWQSVQPSAAVSGRPFRWAPLATTVPSGFTAVGWQALQPAAELSSSAMWPSGGMPWHEVQVTGTVSVQMGVAFDPATLLKLKLPWQ